MRLRLFANDLPTVRADLGPEPVMQQTYKTAHVRSYDAPIQPQTRARLNANFKPSIEWLRELLSGVLPQWEAGDR